MALLFFSSLLTLAHAFSNDDLFIRDLLNLRVVDKCDVSYVYDGEKPKIANEILESFDER